MALLAVLCPWVVFLLTFASVDNRNLLLLLLRGKRTSLSYSTSPLEMFTAPYVFELKLTSILLLIMMTHTRLHLCIYILKRTLKCTVDYRKTTDIVAVARCLKRYHLIKCSCSSWEIFTQFNNAVSHKPA